MALHNDFGRQGEELAISWLQTAGYEVIDRNWRYLHCEIDVVASKGKFLHFIEVKTRHYSPFSHPEDSVTKNKFKKIQKAADHYMFMNPGHDWVQYDILSITLHKHKNHEYFLLEDVYL
jgi:putative endonuclease